jgi:hypothetical protein
MSFTAHIAVTACSNCPFKEEQPEKDIMVCPKLPGEPVIAKKGILEDCKFNKEDIFLSPISEYVKGRNE